MRYNKELAKQICERMGIKWGETASLPTLRGVPITQENFKLFFTSNGCAEPYDANSEECIYKEISFDNKPIYRTTQMAENNYGCEGELFLAA